MTSFTGPSPTFMLFCAFTLASNLVETFGATLHHDGGGGWLDLISYDF